ncbi:tRNA methyltransferase complex GCD14 subunit [Metschnikowia bicuspidata var. bicuspidata NRRL YB-4993]|uniref:tRNA (adenine(58)-N(1))-methyltransferase catalytic subunit TRM61 n=1 Tax=Metschnikowia bicuspidata var. bicuspidata NRRL YB-4993 TaxID=869754 RepID=A0A1A0HFQ3_9ASCO|nr:tRNA methyltransferase complex GCD14 subunit [Metschnikowia bicuspidata var. bicuspidata NRRL YB-4993]OBA22831.1 tRNA methyltransferase complex GCD14 subunit [Metschnikowia bicuspidata var. bicuspidata NRRL YB-4993]
MSFYHYKDYIEEGDMVLAFISRGLLKPLTVTKGEFLNTRFGSFDHDRMIGMKYGSQMGGIKDKGFVHLLHPTPELWTVSLPHRTQIVYTPDSSYIVQRLGISSGSRVIEAGTGSASFTHAFARTVSHEGKVFTYEFHEPRYLEAKRELGQHGLLQENCVITHRDVCNDGFDIAGLPDTDLVEGRLSCDAVFLDLPSPWTAIPNLKSVIAADRRVGICCFSPCIEQVDKTIEALEKNDWTDIEMVEIAGRRWEARKEMERHVQDVIKRLKHIQGRKSQGIESRRLVRVELASTAGEKRPLSEVEQDSALPEPHGSTGPSFNPFGKGLRIREGDEQFNWKQVTKIESEVKTHTSYLTFAYHVPSKQDGVPGQ